MSSLSVWIQTYAKSFGVVAAVILFGAWLVEHLIVERVKSYRDALTRVEEDKATTERFFRLESRLLEVYQVAASARSYSAEARVKERTFKDDLYRNIELLERTSVTRSFAYAFNSYAGRTSGFLSAIKPPPDLANKVSEAVSKIDELRKRLDECRARYEQSQKAVVGEVINPNTITEEQALKIEPVIRQHRDDVEFMLAPQLMPAANEMFRAYDSLFDYARGELSKREAHVRLVRTLQITLYIVGSALAIYGSYLEAISKGTT
jgi:hypothetical protein